MGATSMFQTTAGAVVKASNKCAVSHAKAATKNKIQARLLTRFGRKLVARRLLQHAAQSGTLSLQSQNTAKIVQIKPNNSRSGRVPGTEFCRLPEPSSRVCYLKPLKEPKRVAGSCDLAKKDTRVKFLDNVSVIEIPSHRCYPKESHKRQWMSLRELHANAARNKREFAHDGGDWVTCREENEMLHLHGELVHPATYLMLQREDRSRLLSRLRDLEEKKRSSCPAATTSSSATTVVAKQIGRACAAEQAPEMRRDEGMAIMPLQNKRRSSPKLMMPRKRATLCDHHR